MKKILTKAFLLLIIAQAYLYGSFGNNLKNAIQSEVTSTGDTVMGVLHILVGVFGGLMIIFIALAAIFKSELLKDNLKIIIWTAIITGVLWGVTNNGVSIFQ